MIPIDLEKKINEVLPDILFKYRIWNDDDRYKYHKKLLTDCNLFFPKPDQFIDILDCRFPVEYDFSLENFKREFIEGYPRFSGARVLNNQQLEKLAEYEFNQRFEINKNQGDFIKDFERKFTDSLAVFCLSRKNNSKKMWEEYSLNFTGFCIGYNLRYIYQKIHDQKIAIIPVRYVDEDTPAIKHFHHYQDDNDSRAMDFFVEMVRRKYRKWEFEDEIRLIKVNLNYLDPNFPDFNQVVELPRECFTEVIFGHRMDRNYIDEIITTCRDKSLSVAFKIAVEKDGNVVIEDFEFERY